MRCALLHGFAGTPAAWDDVIDAWQLLATFDGDDAAEPQLGQPTLVHVGRGERASG